MASATSSTTPSGFVFRLPPLHTLVSTEQQGINTCVVNALTWVSGFVDPHVQKLGESITAVWMQQPAKDRFNPDMAVDVMYQPLIAFAQATNQSAHDVYKEQLLRQLVHHVAANSRMNPSDIEAALQGTSAGTSAKLDSKIAQRRPSASLCAHLQQRHPEWTSQKCSQEAAVIAISSIVYPLLVGRRLGLQESRWTPQDSYQKFIECLGEGPLVVVGSFGPEYYVTPPKDYGHLPNLNLPVLTWPKGAVRKEHSVNHTVIIIGVPHKNGANELLYVLDPGQSDNVFVISYENLKKSAHPYVRPISDEHIRYATYALQNSTGTIPREPLA